MCTHDIKAEVREALADLLRDMADALSPGEPEAVRIGPVDFGVPPSPITVDTADLETTVVSTNLDTGRVTLNGSPVVRETAVPQGQIRWDAIGERFLTHDGQVPHGRR